MKSHLKFYEKISESSNMDWYWGFINMFLGDDIPFPVS
mgnify:CR=1 FL=1